MGMFQNVLKGSENLAYCFRIGDHQNSISVFQQIFGKISVAKRKIQSLFSVLKFDKTRLKFGNFSEQFLKQLTKYLSDFSKNKETSIS